MVLVAYNYLEQVITLLVQLNIHKDDQQFLVGGPVVKYIKKRLEIEAQLNLALDTNEDSGTFNLHDLESEGSSQNSLSFKLSYFFN